jgi:hypothetical protein
MSTIRSPAVIARSLSFLIRSLVRSPPFAHAAGFAGDPAL